MSEMKSLQPAAVKRRARGILSHQDRRNPAVRAGLAGGWLLLAFSALAVLAPVAWMFLGSLRSPQEMYAVPQRLLPERPVWDNYREALRLMPFFRYLFNSLVVCLGVVVGQVLVCAMAAYGITKLRLRFGGVVLFLFLTSLMIPVEVLIVPLYLLVRDFPFGISGGPGVNLLDTYWALILPAVFSAFAILILKDFLDEIPNEILYAARVDGCGEARVFFSFVLPMAKPILSILAVFAFVNTWNSFFWPLIALNDPAFYPLVLGLQKLIETGEPWNVVVAALVLGTLPSLVLLALFQRTLIRGIAYTGIYG